MNKARDVRGKTRQNQAVSPLPFRITTVIPGLNPESIVDDKQ
ncbi:MAG: hypothetical protein WBB23_19280 [Desulforhopalus sp.]